jgi:hypothetical protein
VPERPVHRRDSWRPDRPPRRRPGPTKAWPAGPSRSSGRSAPAEIAARLERTRGGWTEVPLARMSATGEHGDVMRWPPGSTRRTSGPPATRRPRRGRLFFRRRRAERHLSGVEQSKSVGRYVDSTDAGTLEPLLQVAMPSGRPDSLVASEIRGPEGAPAQPLWPPQDGSSPQQPGRRCTPWPRRPEVLGFGSCSCERRRRSPAYLS